MAWSDDWTPWTIFVVAFLVNLATWFGLAYWLADAPVGRAVVVGCMMGLFFGGLQAFIVPWLKNRAR